MNTAALDSAAANRAPSLLELTLHVDDADTVRFLETAPDDEREDLALTALRIGVQALRHVRGELDVVRLRQEGDALTRQVRVLLDAHAAQVVDGTASAMKLWFDPTTGHLPARLQRLTAHDGEIATVLRGLVAGDDSEVARTLVRHVGETSPLLRRLDPAQADGVLRQLEGVVQAALVEQRTAIVGQFSLDDKGSALSRLLVEVTDSNGRLRSDLAGDVDRFARQLSLDQEDSALSRLVGRVDKASREVVGQFSLDDDTSALSRLRRELCTTVEEMATRQQEFQLKVLESLTALQTRRKADARGTVHGLDFEAAVGVRVAAEASATGDTFQATGNQVGAIKHCKKGDHVVTLGPEHTGAGRRIVWEAKEQAGFDDGQALGELLEARRNRQADVGVFVFSRRTVPDMRPFRRVGDELLVTWDAEDSTTDVFLHAAHSVARALIVKRAAAASAEVDLSALDRSIQEVERQTEKLGDVASWAGSIKSNAAKIETTVGGIAQALTQRIVELHGHADAVRRMVETGA